jgi:hypothetical protein
MQRRSWLSVIIGVAALVLAGCGSASFSAWRPASDGWIEIATRNFVIDTDLAQSRALRVARALEDSRAALLASAWSGQEPPPGRTRVMLFARQRDLSRYAGRNNQGAVFTRPGFERLLAFTDDFDGDVPTTVGVHELVHDISRWFLPLQPPWLAEGLAVYLEDLEIDRARAQVVTGAVSSDAVKWLRFFSPNARQLLSTLDFESVEPREAASFYLGSWVLVHYLLDERPGEFGRFREALARLMPWRMAWDQSFPGLTHEALQLELERYLDTGRFEAARARFTAPVFTPEVRFLSDAEVHGARALLANTSGQSVAGAEAGAALELDPNELNALTVRFHSLRVRSARSVIATRAVTAHPRDVRAWLLAALAAPDMEERRSALAMAERLDPEHPGVVGLLAEDALARNDPGAALVHVRQAQRRSGVTPRNLALQFAALAASNRCPDAAALLERAAPIFEPACQVSWSSGRRERSCADYARRAYAANCSSPAL